MKRAVLVNGVPASGKSSTARAIASRFGWPLISLDTIKEPFFEELGGGDRAYNRQLGRAAYDAMFRTMAGFPDGMTVVIEAWFGFQPRALLESHLAGAEIGHVLEIWCHAPAEVIADRYSNRVESRPAGHPGREYVPELLELARKASPIGLSHVHWLDTTQALDMSEIDAAIAEFGFK